MTWNRRDFLALSSFALLGSALPLPRSTAWARGRTDVSADQFTPLRGGVGIYENRGGVMAWLISPDGVAVVDTQFADTAPVFAEGLRSRTERRIDVLLNTHHHGDHVGGNAALRPLAERIVAHGHAAELLRNSDNFPAEGRPDTTFDAEWSVTLGNETIRAKHYERGAHTGGDATIFFQEANIVHMGDLMFNRTYPFIDGPAGASVTGWIEVLEEVARDHDDQTTFIFGHASQAFPVTGSREDLMVQRDFLAAALETVQNGIRNGRSLDEVTAGGPPVGFSDHEGPANRLGTLYGVAYQELTT